MLQKKEKGLTRYGTIPTLNNLKSPMSTQLENQTFDNSYFQHHLPQIYRSILKDFRRIVQNYIFLHLFFFTLLSCELIGLLLFISNPVMAALGLGALFLTGFSYLVLHFYYQARKPERLQQLKESFLQSCRRHMSAPTGELQHHLSIAEALLKLASYLEDFEKNFYQPPAFLQFLNPLLNRLSASCYWRDVFKLKRHLLAAAVEEHLKQIRVTPTDLEVHASLATTYVTQSKIYRILSQNRKEQLLFEGHFRKSARLAMEEFRILNHYAPNDPWVHEQLADGYRELEMPEEELKEMEILLQIRPQDKEILFRLGQLYFHQGMNAKGLQIYEELKQFNFKKAEELIASYGQSES
jgi:tetratricopeptide (TPR) repeat protein